MTQGGAEAPPEPERAGSLSPPRPGSVLSALLASSSPTLAATAPPPPPPGPPAPSPLDAYERALAAVLLPASLPVAPWRLALEAALDLTTPQFRRPAALIAAALAQGSSSSGSSSGSGSACAPPPALEFAVSLFDAVYAAGVPSLLAGATWPVDGSGARVAALGTWRPAAALADWRRAVDAAAVAVQACVDETALAAALGRRHDPLAECALLATAAPASPGATAAAGALGAAEAASQRASLVSVLTRQAFAHLSALPALLASLPAATRLAPLAASAPQALYTAPLGGARGEELPLADLPALPPLDPTFPAIVESLTRWSKAPGDPSDAPAVPAPLRLELALAAGRWGHALELLAQAPPRGAASSAGGALAPGLDVPGAAAALGVTHADKVRLKSQFSGAALLTPFPFPSPSPQEALRAAARAVVMLRLAGGGADPLAAGWAALAARVWEQAQRSWRGGAVML